MRVDEEFESSNVMRIGRLLGAWLVALALWAAATPMQPALAQANFDRPGVSK